MKSSFYYIREHFDESCIVKKVFMLSFTLDLLNLLSGLSLSWEINIFAMKLHITLITLPQTITYLNLSLVSN